ncbi:ATP-binding protein [Nevskia sp.]|uniref:sensor histidine kinase n=1 Tax=Nevskia sp. TaxID=1929292 RepID=UPI0025FF4E8E|nr:ATP-binding protein [Nevskia sp.]
MSAAPVVELLRRAERLEPRRPLRAEPASDAALLFEHAAVAIGHVRDRQLQRCNRRLETLFGYGPGELNQRNLQMLYPSYTDYVACGRSSARLLERQGRCRIERQMRRRDGSLFWCQLSGQAVDAGRPTAGSVWTLEDISDRKQAESALRATQAQLEQQLADVRRRHQQELARASRLNSMSEMAGALAHELAQPLAATLNYLHGCQLRLKQGDCTSEKLDGVITRAIQHTETAGSIVRQVHGFVRRHVPETTATDLHALISEMLGLLDHQRRKLGVRVELGLASETPTVLVDALEIRQVLLNLIRNAYEAMTASPAEQRLLRIESRQLTGSRVEVTISDRGPGISPEACSQIFDAYFTTKQDGLGLGLAVCRSIIESHGGSLRVAANPEGGACFRFDLNTVV